ncbi:MAG: xylulose kinase [Proteobacteria bacterium]|nr:xylulose kinase [Pseudomonadota bacterium]
MNPASTVLVIDLGTSGPKVSVFDFDLNCLESAFVEVPLLLGKQEDGDGSSPESASESVEQSPSAWISGIESAIDQIRQKNADALGRVKVVNVTAQWSGTVALSHEGKPLGNAITWMDSRGAPDAAKLTDGFIKVDGYGLVNTLDWIRLTGGVPTRSGKDSISHILYLKRARPGIYRDTKVFLEPKDYLNFHLTGKAAASCDSITVHWVTDNRNIRKIRYSERLLQRSGVDPAKLPELIPVNSILGTVRPEVAERFGIPLDARVVAGTPDLHSAAVGSGGIADFVPHLYIGTSSWIVCHVPFKKTDLFHNIASIPSGIPGRYLMVNEQQTAGASLQFLKNRILFAQDGMTREAAPADVYAKMDALAELVAPGSDGLFYFPWLNGERSPFDLGHLRGGFVNLSLRHSQKHLVRAVMEGVALNLRWLMGYTEKFCGRKFNALRFIGGGAHSRIWSRILADVLNVTIEQMEDPLTANSKGAAGLALMAIGERTMEQVSASIRVRERFEPGEATAVYDRKFREFTEYFKKNENWFRSVNAR